MEESACVCVCLFVLRVGRLQNQFDFRTTTSWIIQKIFTLKLIRWRRYFDFKHCVWLWHQGDNFAAISLKCVCVKMTQVLRLYVLDVLPHLP